MQVYTKILIGMLVGALVGLLLGPNSSLLTADTYKVTQWERLDLRVQYRGQTLDLRLTHDVLTVRSWPASAAPVSLEIRGETVQLEAGVTRHFALAA